VAAADATVTAQGRNLDETLSHAPLGCDDLQEPAELAFYCPTCAEREFRGDS
jgi:hypothetical protein